MQNTNKMVNKNALGLLKNIDGNFKDHWIWDVFSSSRSSNYYLYKLQGIKVERLMTSVIVFIITVDWLHCKANCQTLLGGDDIVLSEKRRVVLSICMSW